MGRNSEIDREQLGSTVLNLYGGGQTPKQIAASISVDRTANFSTQQVQRHIQKNKISDDRIVTMRSATVVDERIKAQEMVVASILGYPDKRDIQTEGIEYYGRYSVNTTNVFDEYYAIARGGISGQVTRAFINIALKMTNGIRLVTDETKQDTLNELMDFIKFKQLSQNIARSLPEMGNVVTLLYDTNDNLTVPEISPMNYITFLTDKEAVGDTESDLLIHGKINRIVHDETGENTIVYDRDKVGLFRIWSDANYFIDIVGRNTFGIYGASMIPEVQTPLKSMMNASYNYDKFIERYGGGRLHLDYALIGELLKSGMMTEESSRDYLKKEAAAQQKIQANEDILSTGMKATMLETKHGLNIVTYLEFREKQIDKALLQSDISAGRVGSQFTNSGNEVSRQELSTLQSLRDTFFDTLLNEVVAPYLIDYNIDIKGVSIVAEPLGAIHVNHRDLIEMEATGNITQGELRQRAGFPEEKPEVVL
jgi:hypothetical protein